jgi:hypothetical protein
MDAFNPAPPEWTQTATHVLKFCCPSCGAAAGEAERVWLNRYAPVTGDNHRRKWQEFYYCHCGKVWWAWSSDRPPSPFPQDRDNFS